MKITKWQFKEALTAAYEAGFDGGRVQQYSPTDVVKRIAKREAKHAKMRKLNNVRKQEHWNVAADHVVNLRGELGAGKSVPVRRHVKLPYKPVMEIDPAQTIDWVDDFKRQHLSDAEQKAFHRLLLERKPTDTSPELAIALNHITNVTLQDLLADYEN